MHEENFTQQIVDAILAELKKYPDQKPEAIRVSVGEMLHLVPESVRLHYGLMTKGTPLEGIALDLRALPVIVRCRGCHHEGVVEDHHFLMCASCGSQQVELLSGDKISIDSIEFAGK